MRARTRTVWRPLDQLDARLEVDLDSPAEELSETLRYVSVLSPQQHLRAAEHGNGGSEGGEDVGKLGRDVSTADDDHRLWQLRQSHHRVGGVEVHRRQPRQIGDYRTAAGRKHQPVGGDRFRRPDVQLSRPDEARVRVENGDIVASLPVAPAVRGHGINSTEDPIPNLPPTDAAEIQINPEPGCLHSRGSKIGRVDEHLAGNAADIEAGPTERPHFDQCHAQLVKPVVDDGVSGSGADDAEVKVPHPAIVPAHHSVTVR